MQNSSKIAPELQSIISASFSRHYMYRQVYPLVLDFATMNNSQQLSSIPILILPT